MATEESTSIAIVSCMVFPSILAILWLTVPSLDGGKRLTSGEAEGLDNITQKG
jgi:hypothetical protein